MGWFTNLLERMRPQGNRALPPQRAAGMFVDEDRALSHSAVYAAVRLISESIAGLPWHLHRRLVPRGNEIVANDLDYLLHVEATPEHSAMVWRETMLANALLWGNAYAEVERTPGGDPWNLWPIAPDQLHPDRTKDGRIWYVHRGAPVLAAVDCFHLRGLGFDGLQGYSVVKHAARSIGLGLALDQMAADTYANGAQPSVIITQDGVGKGLSADAVANLIKSWETRFRGPGNGSRIGYLDAGLKATQFGMPLTDQQFLESRKFQVSEIARWFRVPPHKLADLERATFSNIEHQGLEFVTDTLMPWIRRLESETQVKLIGRNNRSGRLYTKINVSALLRGDLPSRYSAYATGRQWGWLSANDVRELEDQNPVSGGDEYLTPMNMVPADMLREISEPKAPPPPPEPVSPPPNEGEPVEDRFLRLMIANRQEPQERPVNVNVEAPVVNVSPATVTVHMPDIKVEPLVDVGSPIVNVAPTEVHPVFQMDAPVVNVAPAEVRVENQIIEREQPAPIVNVAPAQVTVEAPIVNVAAPDVMVAPPAITIENQIIEREQPAPIVNVAAPNVVVAAPNVDVAAPVVNVAPAEISIEAIMPAQQDVRIISMPARQTVTEVIRDSTGKIVESTQIEMDLGDRK
ncbi:MAG: phage portal protein [Caldilineaceae bacterium]|nr:phage portal protein [Caldilineaceae bacterium]